MDHAYPPTIEEDMGPRREAHSKDLSSGFHPFCGVILSVDIRLMTRRFTTIRHVTRTIASIFLHSHTLFSFPGIEYAGQAACSMMLVQISDGRLPEMFLLRSTTA